MRKCRQFTPEFKAQVVLDVLTGRSSPAVVCRQHALNPNLLATWKAAFLERAPSVFQAEDRRQEDQARIAAPKRLLGRVAMQAEILKKASTLGAGAPTSGGRRR
ncbi:MAG: transposase [Isosphaeraceae bacterium]|nr:transposase [Isosphaeraceae bacterium]